MVTKAKVAYGILGFVRFLKGFYIILITEKKKVAKIGRHNIYKIKEQKVIPLFTMSQNYLKEDEEKYLQMFKDIEIG
jgi:hypothetical protein